MNGDHQCSVALGNLEQKQKTKISFTKMDCSENSRQIKNKS